MEKMTEEQFKDLKVGQYLTYIDKTLIGYPEKIVIKVLDKDSKEHKVLYKQALSLKYNQIYYDGSWLNIDINDPKIEQLRFSTLSEVNLFIDLADLADLARLQKENNEEKTKYW